MSLVRRLCSCALILSFGSMLPIVPAAAAGSPIAYRLTLSGGRTAIVLSNGIAQVYNKDHTKVLTRVLQPGGSGAPDAMTVGALPDKAEAMHDLFADPHRPYASGDVVVVFRDGVGAQNTETTLSRAQLLSLRKSKENRTMGIVQAPQYTNDPGVNRALADMGTDRVQRLFHNANAGSLGAMRSYAQSQTGTPLLNIANAYRVHVTGASVPEAVTTLLKQPGVAYASPDWVIGGMHAHPIPINAATISASRMRRVAPMSLRRSSSTTLGASQSTLPTNTALASSAQSLLNAPSVDAAAAYDEIETKFHQLPGQGEIITNVSLGDLDDASAAANASDPCHFYAANYGPTSIVTGGQRYLDFPGMPLIAAYTADANGNINPTGEVCGVDPYLDEIGLDFSVMAPLPDSLQRPGEQAYGMNDLLGIAPGATYRLVVPADSAATISEIDAALLAAAQQTPKPDVINASIGFGLDQYGFSGRYLEDDPLSESIIASIVHYYGIVVTISAGDGVRTYTNVAIGPDGGSTPTDVISRGLTPTDLNDVAFSGVPSRDYDSGSIDVGGTTLDDIFARPPQYANGIIKAQHAYAETRWTGFTNFSSGDGSRVNVSAPADNILSLTHPYGGAADSVSLSLGGGTSASAPETAAAAAVVLQIARLTGHPLRPRGVRALLEDTGSPVLPVPQANTDLNVGPQIDLRRAVERLMRRGDDRGTPSVARVAIEQRKNYSLLDAAFLSATDPNDIQLEDPYNQDRYQTAWITIAPDWEWVKPGADYRLYVTGHPERPIATTAWARVLPKEILDAAGMPLAATSNRTVNLTYDAIQGRRVLTSASFTLTFGPTNPTHYGVLAADVPPVVHGATIPVSYDLRDVRGVNNPEIIVSEPGRMSPVTGNLFHPIYTVSLVGLNGTVNIPVNALKGGGIYGVDLIYDSVSMRHADPAFTRVVPMGASSDQAIAPLLSQNNSTPGHYLDIPYGGSFQVSYDVSDVPGATGAILEISAAGPGAWRISNPFNNPGGSVCDNNGVDSGSVYCRPVFGTKGSVMLNGTAIGLIPTLNHVIRVIPTKFGSVAGEAGKVSTITMDGIAADDGGGVQNGFGVAQGANDGYITSGQLTAAGQYLTSVETFDQATNHIVKGDASAANGLYYSVGASGMFGNDIALLGLQDMTTNNSTYNLLNTVASGTMGAAWTPPAYVNNLYLSEAAENNATDVAAFYGYDPSGANNDHFRVFTSDLLHNTFSSLYDVSAPLLNMGFPQFWGMAENTTTNEGVLPAADFFANCGPTTLVTVDLGTGKVGSFLGTGAGFPYGIAIDSKTDKAAVPTLCDGGLSIYNLATNTSSEVLLPGNHPGGPVFNGFYTESDPINGRFLVEQTTSPDFGYNNNSLSRVLVYDESGNLLETKQQFDLFGAFLPIQAHNLQVNPARKQGYLIGPLAVQLEPFSY